MHAWSAAEERSDVTVSSPVANANGISTQKLAPTQSPPNEWFHQESMFLAEICGDQRY